jgi:hypothetical protein
LRGEEAATRTLLLLFLSGLSLFLFSHDAVSENFCAVALKILRLVKISSARKNPEKRAEFFSSRVTRVVFADRKTDSHPERSEGSIGINTAQSGCASCWILHSAANELPRLLVRPVCRVAACSDLAHEVGASADPT